MRDSRCCWEASSTFTTDLWGTVWLSLVDIGNRFQSFCGLGSISPWSYSLWVQQAACNAQQRARVSLAGWQSAYLETQGYSFLAFTLHHSFCGRRKEAAELPCACKELVPAGSGWRTGPTLVRGEHLCRFLNWSCSSRYRIQKISSAKQVHQEFITDSVGFMQCLGLLVVNQ